ncbi:hypothetical protein AOLI_G00015170 [Acnodon oligacanthus]
MFVEIEQKVSSVSALGNDEEEQRALSAKLQRLKKNLLTFQLLLQERHTDEQACVGRERPLQVRLQRSCSVQEILTSNKGKLFRQSSLQQQRQPWHEEEEEEDVFVDVREEEDDDDEYVDARTEDGEYGISSYAPGGDTCTAEDADSGGPAESTEQDRMVTDPKDVEPAPEASAQEAGPKPTATVRTQSPPKELVTKTPFVRELSKSPSRGQQKCVVS